MRSYGLQFIASCGNVLKKPENLMIVTVCSEKGGVGKSTLSAHAAVRLAMTGKPTLLIDADPQGTSYYWSVQRRQHRPDADQVDCEHLAGNLIETVRQHIRYYRHIVIDCGGADSTALRSSLLIADRAIIPTQVSRRDLMAVSHIGSLISEANESRTTPITARVVFNRTNPLPTFWTRIDEAREAIEAKGIEVTDAVIRQRVAYDDSEQYGGTVYEHNDEKAKSEIESVLKILLRKNPSQEPAK
ncbi:AAA family ATPase (plasmid) [Halospina sp. K52047b]|nr:AAA family ATPase [Halospina sp. K52047b]